MLHRLPSPLTPAALATAMVLGSAGLAAAQAQPPMEPLPAPQPPAQVEREGFLLGISAGFGSLDADGESESTLNYHLEFGGFLSHDWAIAVGFWGGQHNEDFGSTTNSNAGLMAQYWLSDSWWLKGAIGTANLSAEYEGTTFADYNGMAIAAMGAWQFYTYSDYHLFASLSLTSEGYEDLSDNVTATAIQIGLQYF